MNDCAAPRHDQPEPAAPAAHLCHGCLSRLRSDLRRLPHLHAALAALLDMSGASQGDGDGTGLHYNAAAADAMSQIAHDLQYWSRWVLDTRRPAACPVPAVPAMAGWLAGWTAWVSLRPEAGDMAGALAADRGRALAILSPRPYAEIPIPLPRNWCPDCGAHGALVAVMFQAPDDRRPSLLACGACGREWDTTQWYRLGQRILARAERRAA